VLAGDGADGMMIDETAMTMPRRPIALDGDGDGDDDDDAADPAR